MASIWGDVLAITWNVNAITPPPAAELSAALHSVGAGLPQVQLAVVGLQEATQFETDVLDPALVPAPPAPLLAAWAAAWGAALESVCGAGAGTCVVQAAVGSIVLLLYVRPGGRWAHLPPSLPLARWVTRAQTLSGIKGAIAVSLPLHAAAADPSEHAAIVVAHLEANTENYHVRLQEYSHIATTPAWAHVPWTVPDHAAQLWLGDFNMRIDLPRETVFEAVAASNWELLQAHDQAEGAMLVGASEGALAFAPSYKYDIGTSVYDTSAKARAPAWCDRALCAPPAAAAYTPLALAHSDHRPVAALFAHV